MTSRRLRRPVAAGLRIVPLVALLFSLGATTAACAEQGGAPTSPAVTASEPAPAASHAPMGDMHKLSPQEMTAAWDARPDYVRALSPDWQAAYAFALASPEVLQWLPCYCGCGGMGHRSNLDCFFQRREVQVVYEEHGSFCDICVETANTAASMIREGSTMVQIRAAIDQEFGGRAPGTDTPLPPA
jgi:hypothetical protein